MRDTVPQASATLLPPPPPYARSHTLTHSPIGACHCLVVIKARLFRPQASAILLFNLTYMRDTLPQPSAILLFAWYTETGLANNYYY